MMQNSSNSDNSSDPNDIRADFGSALQIGYITIYGWGRQL